MLDLKRQIQLINLLLSPPSVKVAAVTPHNIQFCPFSLWNISIMSVTFSVAALGNITVLPSCPDADI